MIKTREQMRMQATWDALITKFGDSDSWSNGKNKAQAKSYLTAVKKTPARIHTAGLGQALAFLKSRGNQEAKDACADLSRITLSILGQNEHDLLASIRKGDSAFLFLATDEAIAVCGWLARFLAGAGVTAEDDSARESEEGSGK
ncbi:MAG TPA: type III-B CRISPR module-associated protein Cmr5 [Chthonomonadales bacterium]|nr:type III-B CRISPR module-associated protein Cmr5 [Chthonomonadales bacterium]